MPKITADHILSGDGKVYENHVLQLDDDGRIIEIRPFDESSDQEVIRHKGTIFPGLINTHCHLELSHLKGAIPTGTGLVEFITGVVQLRAQAENEIQSAIKTADAFMYQNGIQAVGDISNKLDTSKVKDESPISYYTFVEMFDFMDDAKCEGFVESYNQVYEGQSSTGRNRKSKVPHAPYSVSPSMFKYLAEANSAEAVISMHNQETPSENQLFQTNDGKMVDFFRSLGVAPASYPAKGINSIDYALQFLNPEIQTILVHNTICEQNDLDTVSRWSKNVFWATCPNANLYIENKLPDYSLFIRNNCKMTIGTDSLTSNWRLSIWDEMQTILKYCSYITFDQVLLWASLNGAEALKYDDELGSIAVGKKPGILLSDFNYVGEKSDIQGSKLVRLF